MILQSLAGLPAFLVYFRTGLIAMVAYLFVYTRITPHNEFQLIRDHDPAAAIALGLSLLGFVAPLFSAIAHSANVLDCLIWAAIALIVQVAVFYIVKIPVPNLSGRIAAGELAPAIWLGLSSLAAGSPLPNLSGVYPVVGSWLVNHEPCGLSIREDESPITGNSSRFLPHAIL